MADNDYIVGAPFLDLSKVFDTINHELLLKKMQLNFGRGKSGSEHT